jgi:nitrogen fixation NifU-like protein
MSESSLYDDVIMDHIKNARNYRALDDPARRASGINPFCGDEMTVYLRLDPERVEEIAFQCSCCGISMASASMMTELVTGKTVTEIRRLIRAFADFIGRGATEEDASVHQRALAEVVRRYPVRRRCALLPWLTLEAALDGREEASIAG